MTETTHDPNYLPNLSPSPLSPSPQPRRARRGRKRAHFQRMPVARRPLRALWDAATEEDRAKAHQRCTVMLEYWLGRISKAQAAEKLQIPQIRVHQLSQQALSGMGVALLKQVRTRVAMAASASDPQRDPKALRQKITELEREVKTSRDLINLLKELPIHREHTQRDERKKTARKPKNRVSQGNETPRGSGAPVTGPSHSAG
jgi:hypothetical protein